jgi:type IV secretion system protein VirB10
MAELAAPVPEREDVVPVVPLAQQGNRGLIAFIIVLLAGGAMLFSALSANRTAMEAPRTTLDTSDSGARIAAPPPLALPPEYLGQGLPPPVLVRPRDEMYPPAVGPRAALAPTGGARQLPPPPEPTVYAIAAPPAPAPLTSDDIFGPGVSEPAVHPRETRSGDRVTAGRFANPSRTVPRGTVIPAVLETALDSTRPGAARAMVQRAVHSFDGTRVLIPRGSRLYGEYAADLATGQRRAGIQWTRLLRPDGVTIELDSPASDPLGRAGVAGKVDNKFFQRFGGAILQSVLDIGVGIATREATNGVILALPGSTQNVRVQDEQKIAPTLKVRQGTSVSVFVARDLDFSTVDP